MRLGSNRAVSTVVATILMINIALVLGVMAYLYSQNILGTLTSNYSIFLGQGKERMLERISIVNIRFYDTDDLSKFRFNITVMNTGSRHVWLSSIYINGTDVMPEISDYGKGAVWDQAGDIQSSTDGGYLMVVGSSLTFAFKPDAQVVSSMEYDRLQSIVAVTSMGVVATEQFYATEGV